MKWKIVYNAWWLKLMFWFPSILGMVFFRWMWVKGGSMSHRMFRHELQHCYDQHEAGGRLRWYAKYFILLIKHGYRNHPMEVNAERYENDELTTEELVWLRTGRIIMNKRRSLVRG